MLLLNRQITNWKQAKQLAKSQKATIQKRRRLPLRIVIRVIRFNSRPTGHPGSCNSCLEVSQGISSYRKNVPLNVHPECEDEINNQGRAKGKKGNINKPGADARWCNTQLITDGRTYPKEFPLYEVFQFIHTAKL